MNRATAAQTHFGSFWIFADLHHALVYQRKSALAPGRI
jgi:hypothetical protein